jgi:hypothetical protein
MLIEVPTERIAEKTKLRPAVEYSLISPTRQSQIFPRPVMDNSAASMFGTDKTLVQVQSFISRTRISVKQFLKSSR